MTGIWWGSLSLASVALTAAIAAHRLGSFSRPLQWVMVWNIACAEILLLGFVLGKGHWIGNLSAWTLGTVLVACITWLAAGRPDIRSACRSLWPDLPLFWSQLRSESRVGSWILLPLLLCFVPVMAYQILICIFLAPTNADSCTYILPRVAHYIQQGSLDYYFSNFIAQTVHFKNLSVLQIYVYLAGGRMENLVQLIALFSYWVAMLSVYGTALFLWKKRTAALFAALVFGSLTSALMISVTPQSDMPITGFVSSAVWLVLAYAQTRQRKYLFCGLGCMAMAFGVKASSLLLIPALGLVVIFALVQVARSSAAFSWPRELGLTALASVVAAALFMLPSGYYDNWRRYGHVMGPEKWRGYHTMEEVPPGERLGEGHRNLCRYIIHFVSLDGFPWAAGEMQALLRKPLDVVFNQRMGIDIHSQKYTRVPFQINDFNTPNEDMSFWGINTLWFIIPAMVLCLRPSCRSPGALVLIIGGVLYFLAQSYLSLYDPWRGRSFTNLGVFLAPLTGVLFWCGTPTHPSWWSKIHGRWILLGAGVLLAAYSLFNAGLFRYSSPLVSNPNEVAFEENCIFMKRDRLWQITRSNSWAYERFARFEQEVPAHATVAVLVSSDYNYILYGEGFTRAVDFCPENQIPREADYLVFNRREQNLLPGDVCLDGKELDGEEDWDELWCLRKLR